MIRICPACGKRNRVPPKRLADRGRCGHCKAPLPSLSSPLEVDRAQFEAITSSAKVPILVDFWAAWCGPCKMAEPEVVRLADEMAGEALVLKVNTAQHPELAARYGVRGIPNFMVLKAGEVVFQQAGLANHQQMRTWLTSS
jgi:thioredoxin 2